MNQLLEALFQYAVNNGDLTRWLTDRDIAETYELSARYAQELKEQLLTALSHDSRTLFQKFLVNLGESHQLECELLFCQGLAMGLYLGALPL